MVLDTCLMALGNKDPLTIGTALIYMKAPSNFNDNVNLFVIENPYKKLLQLDYGGLLHVREVKLDADDWPDYVFEPSYKLRSIKDLGIYMNKYKHLPNVPDAKTMEKEGMNLSEMNKLAFEKIEELSIYVVQLNELMEAQAKKIQELELLLQK